MNSKNMNLLIYGPDNPAQLHKTPVVKKSHELYR